MNENEEFTFEDYKIEKRSRWRRYISKGGIIAFFIINGLLTGVYGLFAVFSTYPLNQQSSIEMRALVYVLGFVFAGVLVVLLDGSRAIWHEAALDDHTSGSQQLIARVMETIMLFMSIFASVMAMRVIFHVVGISQLTETELSDSGVFMTWIVGFAITADILAGWGYEFISPVSKMRRSEARRQALTWDTISDNADYQVEASKRGLDKALASDHPSFVQDMIDRVRSAVNRAIGSNNAPRHVVAQDAPKPPTIRDGKGGNERPKI